jgi:hypothetical protein
VGFRALVVAEPGIIALDAAAVATISRVAVRELISLQSKIGGGSGERPRLLPWSQPEQ